MTADASALLALPAPERATALDELVRDLDDEPLAALLQGLADIVAGEADQPA